MNLTCFNTSDPSATNADKFYDESVSGDLWLGDGQPLPPCPSTSPTSPTSRCVLCTVDQMVHVVCSNLKEKFNMMLEAAGHHVDITESECPRLLDDQVSSSWSWLQHFGVVAAVIFILALLCFLLWKFIFGGKKLQYRGSSENNDKTSSVNMLERGEANNIEH